MTTSSKINVTNSQTLNKVISLIVFLLSIAIGIILPVIAIPWMFLLAYVGFTYKKEQKTSFLWLLGRTAMAAAIVLGAIILVVLVFFLPWLSKPII